MVQAGKATSTAHDAAVATHDNATPPSFDWVIADTLETARAQAEHQGVPQYRAVTTVDAAKVVRQGQYVLLVHQDGGLEGRAITKRGEIG